MYNDKMNSSDKISKKNSAIDEFNFLSDSQNSGSSSPTISPVLEFLQEIDKIIKSDTTHKSKILFRGQKCSNWKVRTSAYIRLKREINQKVSEEADQEVSEEDELYYNLGLIEQFKHADFNSSYSSEIMKGDLGILAELQHQGAATSLIDFSDNPLIALWFACQKSLELDNKNIKDSKDGKVFILSTNDKSKFAEIDDLGQINDYSSILSNEKLFYWKPAHLNKRITAQQSYFLIGKRIPPQMEEISIPENSKSKILKELSSVYGINEITLYPDIVGFAQANSIDSTYGKEKEWLRNRVIILHHDKIIKINPQDLQAYDKRGIAKYNLGEYKNALNDFNHAISIYPNYANAYYHRGKAKGGLKDYKGAIDDYNEATKIDPNNADAYYYLGHAKYELNDYKEAINNYTKAINNYTKAINNYTKAINIDSNHENAYYHRGTARYILEEYQGAIDDFTKAIKLNPNDAILYSNRGNAKHKLNDHKGAINDYNKSIDNNPNDDSVYNNRGNSKYSLEDYQGAIHDYTEVIKIDPNNDNILNSRGTAKGQLEDYKGAINDFTRSISINPNNINAYRNRGFAKNLLGVTKTKLKNHKEIIDHHKEATDYLKEAIDDYQTALKFCKDKDSIESITTLLKSAKEILGLYRSKLRNLKNKHPKKNK